MATKRTRRNTGGIAWDQIDRFWEAEREKAELLTELKASSAAELRACAQAIARYLEILPSKRTRTQWTEIEQIASAAVGLSLAVDLSRKNACPACGHSSGVPVVYGTPTRLAFLV